MKINPHTGEAYKLFHEGVLAFARAEQQGFRVDLDYIENKKKHLTRRMDRLEQQFKDTNLYKHWEHSQRGKVNIYSNAQLAHYLYEVKKVESVKETMTGQGSTDDESLKQMGLPELDILLELRKLRKVRDTYLDAFAREQVNGYIHPFFNLHLVRTFRSSSDSPNFQNIPKRDEESMNIVRRALFPRPGHLLMEMDFSGLEVRIAACYHKDPAMLHYIKEPKSDMHGDMTKQIFMLKTYDKKVHDVLRQAVKNGFVFPEFYGDYYVHCAPNMACGWCKLPQGKWTEEDGIIVDGKTIGKHMIEHGITSLKSFEKHIQKIEEDFWGVRFADYAEWKKRWWNTYQKYGYLDLYTGFRCSGTMGRNDAINYPVQGAAFHCNLWTFIQMDKRMREEKWDTRLIGQIHDSIILDVHPDELQHVIETARKVTCEELPEAWKWIIVPLDIEIETTPIDGNWSEKCKIKN
jgi:DNA polymerase-1